MFAACPWRSRSECAVLNRKHVVAVRTCRQSIRESHIVPGFSTPARSCFCAPGTCNIRTHLVHATLPRYTSAHIVPLLLRKHDLCVTRITASGNSLELHLNTNNCQPSTSSRLLCNTCRSSADSSSCRLQAAQQATPVKPATTLDKPANPAQLLFLKAAVRCTQVRCELHGA